MNYQTSKKGLIFLASLEGVGLSKYLDSVGVWTIALGATRTEIPDLADWPLGKSITLEEAFSLLRRSIVKYEKTINLALTTPVSQEEFDALVSICYNIGQRGAANSTFIKRINAGAKVDKIVEAILMWNKPEEIIGRRRKEAKLFSTGNYGDGKITVFPVSATGHPIYSKGKVIDGNQYL